MKKLWYLKAYLALASLSVPAVQIVHERLITVLPKKGHVLMTLTECLDLILLHVGYNLMKYKQNFNLQTTELWEFNQHEITINRI